MSKEKHATVWFVLSLVNFLILFLFFPAGIILSIVIIIFSIISLRKHGSNNFMITSLILSIIALIMAILLILFIILISQWFIQGPLSYYEVAKNSTYEETLELCLSKNIAIDQSFCISALILNNPNHTDVVSGDLCRQFSDGVVQFSCAYSLAKDYEDEKYCEIILNTDLRSICQAGVTKDPSYCEDLDLNAKLECLDEVYGKDN